MIQTMVSNNQQGIIILLYDKDDDDEDTPDNDYCWAVMNNKENKSGTVITEEKEN